MDHFRTVVSPGISPHSIGLADAVLTVGSCFADGIGSRLAQSKLQALSNPFGVIYNPFSIHKVVRYAVFNESVHSSTFLQHHDVHLNYDFHSGLSSLHANDLRQRLNDTIGAAHHFLARAKWLLITYGTAFVYERADTGEVVANCHKQPAAMFRKSLLGAEQVSESFAQLYSALKPFNPGLRIILTVSPVRHLKDTLELNSVSKSALRLACHTIASAHADVDYFPAYEMLLDDLRDYRFYKSDMLHPTVAAEDYIWGNFAARYFGNDVHSFLEKWKVIQSALAHKPFHPASDAHQRFLRETWQRLNELKTLVNVDTEIEAIKKQLIP